MQHEATLIHGRSYTVFGQTFLRDIPGKTPLSDAQKKELEAEAVDVVKTTDGERMDRCKFAFRQVKGGKAQPGGDGDGEGGEGEGQTAAPAARTRKRGG